METDERIAALERRVAWLTDVVSALYGCCEASDQLGAEIAQANLRHGIDWSDL